jgi:hypothetical protein
MCDDAAVDLVEEWRRLNQLRLGFKAAVAGASPRSAAPVPPGSSFCIPRRDYAAVESAQLAMEKMGCGDGGLLDDKEEEERQGKLVDEDDYDEGERMQDLQKAGIVGFH